MQLEDLSTLLVQVAIHPHFILTFILWLTYGYTLKCGFVSDDLEGIANYNGNLQVKEGLDSKGKSFIWKLLRTEYGMLSRWLRYHICGGNFPSTKKDLIGGFIPQGKLPYRHHLLSLTIFTIGCNLIYLYLEPLLGQRVALLALLLFIVHPIGTYTVAWCSGLGYILSLIWMMLLFLLVNWYVSLTYPSLFLTVGVLGLFCLLQFLATHAQFATMMSFVVLGFFGYYEFAFISFVMACFMGTRIVKETIGLRVKAFKEQAMGASTFLKPRKFIVAMKTLLYYLGFVVWPKRMGLYHEWGSHYDSSYELDDKRFYIGLLAFLGLAGLFFLLPFPYNFSILWFVSFSVIFWNWITIQQFVTERYIYIPCLGLCIALSYLLQNSLYVYLVIFMMALMRTWVHLPTFDNELKFYLSNTWNFENSHVAYGNLGCTYTRVGMQGTAIDYWLICSKLNPEYDVPYYNIYSYHRTNAANSMHIGNFNYALEMLQKGREFLVKAVSCKICHFKDAWSKELSEIDRWINKPIMMVFDEHKRLISLRIDLLKMLAEAKDDKRQSEVNSSIVDNNTNISKIEKIIRDNGYDPEILIIRSLTNIGGV